MRYAIDSNHASAITDGNPKLSWDRLDQHSVYMPVIVPAEHWYLVMRSTRVHENVARLRELVDRVPVLQFDELAAEQFGGMRSQLSKIGRMIPIPDIQIAALAMVRDRTLLTADAHFQFVPNLRTENWLS
jgi:tRNA(fMet)-specific endonuclease VapC